MQPTKGFSIDESAGTLRIRCTWLGFFVITIGPEYKQDTLSHHFIQRSCKYFGGRHQLYLDRKQCVTTTTSDSFQPLRPKWISSWCTGTPGPLTLAETPLHVWPKCNHVQTNHYYSLLVRLKAKEINMERNRTQCRSQVSPNRRHNYGTIAAERNKIRYKTKIFKKRICRISWRSPVLELKITRFSQRKKLLSFTADLQHVWHVKMHHRQRTHLWCGRRRKTFIWLVC